MMPRNSPYTLEVCVETPRALAAVAHLADQVELCSGLDVGGLTPSHGLLTMAAHLGVTAHVLIRERCGDFTMSPEDIAAAVASIRAVRQLGLHGVVIGAEKDGALDRAAIAAMMDAAEGLDVTLHRVIDVVDDPLEAMELAIEYGMTRILTSGAARSASEGIAGLTRLHTAANGRIEIMAGAGIKSANIGTLKEQTDIKWFHASCSAESTLLDRYTEYGFGRTERQFDLQ